MVSGNVCTVLQKKFWISKDSLDAKESIKDCKNKKGVLAEFIEPDLLKQFVKHCMQPRNIECDDYPNMDQYRFNLKPCIKNNKVVKDYAYIRNKCVQHKFRSFKVKDSVNVSNLCEFVFYANDYTKCENVQIRPTKCHVKRNYICQIPESYEGSSHYSSTTTTYNNTDPFIENYQAFSTKAVVGITLIVFVFVVLLFLIVLIRRKRLHKNCNTSFSNFSNTFSSMFFFKRKLKSKSNNPKTSKFTNSKNVISSISIEETYVK